MSYQHTSLVAEQNSFRLFMSKECHKNGVKSTKKQRPTLYRDLLDTMMSKNLQEYKESLTFAFVNKFSLT